jgi:hypothetical protein
MRKFTFPSGKLNGGLYNKDDDTIISKNQLSDCQNVIYDKQGFSEKRDSAFTSAAAGSEWRTGEDKIGKKIYTYVKRDNSRYFIVQTGTKVMCSTDLISWTSLNPASVDFNENYVMAFVTFADRLIFSNGFDSMYFWDGSMTSAAPVGSAVLTLGSTGSVDNGVHKVKITFEDDAGVIYAYDVVSEITVTGTKKIEMTIPVSPDNAKVDSRKIWVTAAGGTTYYSALNTLYQADSTNTFSFNLGDTALAGFQAYSAYISGKSVLSITPPKARFLEIYDNQLFYAHTTDGPSEVGWSEPMDPENFYPANIDAISTDDGEYITGIKLFKSMNQLLVFKKSTVYVEYLRGDTYTHRTISQQGCSFSGSIQEFYVDDKNGARSTVIWANRDGLWEWDGSNPRKASEPVDTMFSRIKQREYIYDKATKTTTADFTASGINDVIPKSISYPNNFMDIGVNDIEIKNVFNFTITGITDDVSNFIWEPVTKRMYAIWNDSNTYKLVYYTWDSAASAWTTKTVMTATGLGVTTGTFYKMVYDSINDKFYAMFNTSAGASYGYIQRTGSGNTDWAGGSISIDLTNIATGSAEMCIHAGKLFFTDHATITLSYPTGRPSPANTYTETYRHLLLWVSLLVFDDSHKYAFWTSTFQYVYSAIIGSSKSTITTYKHPNFESSDGKIFLKSDGNYLYVTRESFKPNENVYYEYVLNSYPDPSPEFDRTVYIYNTLVKIDTSNIATAYVSVDGTNRYVSVIATYLGMFWYSQVSGASSPITQPGIAATIVAIKDKSLLNFMLKSKYLGTGPYGPSYLYNFVGTAAASGNYYLWHSYMDVTAGAPTPWGTSTNKFTSIGGEMGADIGMCLSRYLFQYFIKDTGEMYEYNLDTYTNVSLGTPTGATGFTCAGWAHSLGTGVPEMVIVKYATIGGSAVAWRGILGDYTLSGTWILTSTNSIDVSADGEYLGTYEVERLGSGTGAVVLSLATTPLDSDIPDWNTVSTGQILEGTGTLFLAGTNRYIHERVVMTFNVGTNCAGSTSGEFAAQSIKIGATTINWTNFDGTAVTQIESIVFNNFYILSAVEPATNATYNNVLFVLDRFKRWAIWRGINAACFTIFKDKLYWTDSSSATSDWIFSLGTKTDYNISDMYVTTDGDIGTKAIDAWITTKNYDSFDTGYDNAGLKKHVRHMYITSRRMPYTGTYNLIIEDNVDEEKLPDGIGATDLWNARQMSIAADSQGKINSRVDYGLLGKRYRFRFRNSTSDQDLAMIEFVIMGWVLHGRD